MPQDLQLWFHSLQVGVIRNVFYSDLNWYGLIELNTKPEKGNTFIRVSGFIEFCVDWHKRLEEANSDKEGIQNAEPDAGEFETYQDVLEPGQWFIKTANGQTQPIETPVFWPAGEVCWRVGNV